MNALIIKTLSPLGLPIFFIEQGENNSYPQIVFNIRKNPWTFSDDKEEGIKYDINMTLLSKGDFLETQEQIEDLMISAGFVKGKHQYPEYVAPLECYAVLLRFSYYKQKTKEK